jgi:DNA (cytosine-5)-methyltransferase 1
LQGFVKNWTKPAAKVVRESYRWRLVGNAVAVPVAEWIGERLIKPHAYDWTPDEELKSGEPWPRAAWGGFGDGKRFGSEASSLPARRKSKGLVEFLRHDPRPLSNKAAAGFLFRAKRARDNGSLKFEEGFLESLAQYVESGKPRIPRRA